MRLENHLLKRLARALAAANSRNALSKSLHKVFYLKLLLCHSARLRVTGVIYESKMVLFEFCVKISER